jgi:N-acyl-D-amino-acid deacylase
MPGIVAHAATHRLSRRRYARAVSGPDAILVRGGTLVDGTGDPARPADVLLRDGRVAALGALDEAPDARVLDADGLVVTPGFVDVHTHADFTLLAFPEAESAVAQGVTTVVVGNCGGGVAPCRHGHDVRRVAFGYRDDWGVEIEWESFGEYLRHLDGKGVNVAALVPHGAVRNVVLGLDERPPDGRELDTMRGLVREGLDAGAIGMSTGLEYQPGCHASPEEIAALCAVVAERNGVYATHMRDRGDRFAAATGEALDTARATGVRLQLSHVAPRPYAPADERARAFEAVEAARGAGVPVWVDTFPETWGPGNLADLFPREVTQGTPREVVERLHDPRTRRAVERAFAEGRNFLVRAGGYDRIFISSSPVRPDYTGRSLADLAAEAGTTVAAFACDALAEAGDELMSVGIRHVYATEEDLRAVLALPYASLGSDGVVTSGEGEECPFPWNASSYGYVPRLFERYVREEGLMTLEEAVRRLAALPAEALGLADRGVLREGAAADVVVFDPARVHDRTTPADVARYAEGFSHVLVGGVPVVEDGRFTGERPGSLVS